MGIIATLLKLTRGEYKVSGNSPGKAPACIGSGMAGQTLSAEIYSSPGVMAVPGENSMGIYIPVGGSARYGIIIAHHNYQIEIDLNKGDTAIYSTSEDGKTVKSKIYLKNDGNIEINGNDKRFVTYSELNSALQNFVSAVNSVLATKKDEGGSAGTLTIDISAAETQTVKTGG